MTSRLKRLVHRGKDQEKRRRALQDQLDEDKRQDLQTSPYDHVTASDEPAQGDYPFRGRTSSLLSKFSRSPSQASQSSQGPTRRLTKRRPISLPPSSPVSPAPNTSTHGEADAAPSSRKQTNQPVVSKDAPAAQASRTSRARLSMPHIPRDGDSLEATRINHWPVPDGDVIADRAKSNSIDTEVVQTVAPTVTHETVTRTVHHVRHEQITREIHDHEIYHRILPVVDVEVLPARHFLPAESGGLMEVRAEDVPGRSKTWVLAETVSQIPSNQAAATTRRQFSARTFEDGEGKAQAYVSPEGYEVTERTWVHAPTLATGARDTGQSWPLDMNVPPSHDREARSKAHQQASLPIRKPTKDRR